MSPQEHYFENLLFAFVRGGREQFNKCKENDKGNLHWLDDNESKAIVTCAIYIIDCCNWNPEVVGDFLHGNFTTSSQ